jgi:transposase-like protein
MSDRDDGHRPEGPVARRADDAVGIPPLAARRKGRALSRPEPERPSLTAEQRLLILDSWMRSKLSAPDFAPLVGVSPHTLYAWKRRTQSRRRAARRSTLAWRRWAGVAGRTMMATKQTKPKPPIDGSPQARQQAATILETRSGATGPSEASTPPLEGT